jgi:hypothetical protein
MKSLPYPVEGRDPDFEGLMKSLPYPVGGRDPDFEGLVMSLPIPSKDGIQDKQTNRRARPTQLHKVK